jgi:hypothetical protein
MTILAVTKTVTMAEVWPVLALFAFLGFAIWFTDWFKRWSTRQSVAQLGRWIAEAEARGHLGSGALESARDFFGRAQRALMEKNFNDAGDLASLGREQLECLKK